MRLRVKQIKYKCAAVLVAGAISFTGLVVPVHAGDYVDDLYLFYNNETYLYKNRLVTLEINGEELKTGDMPAILIEDTTMVPVREVFESDSIAAKVDWNPSTNEVYVNYKDNFIVLKVGSKTAYVNSEEVTLDVAPTLVRDMSKANTKTMLPLRFVAENLDFDVDWDSDTFTAIITSEDQDNSADTEDKDNAEDKEGESTGSKEDGTGVETPQTNTGSEVDESKDDDVVTSPDTNDFDDDEQLNRLEGGNASRSLPTALANNPVSFMTEEETFTPSVIKPMNTGLTYIQDVEYEDDNGENIFIINASDPISDLDWFMLDDGKVVLDVKNAKYDRPTMEIDYKQNTIVDKIRFGQHVDEESNLPQGRIVFDLLDPSYQFDVSLNEDRDQILVKALGGSMKGIKLGQSSVGDYIELYGVSESNVSAFRLSNPSRLVFDIANTVSPLGSKSAKASGQYVTSIRTAQFDAGTTRVVVETDGQPDYDISSIAGEGTFIQIKEPSFDNISYDNSDKTPTITIDKDADKGDLTMDNITYKSDYLERAFTITLPGDYQDYFGSEDIKINDSVIKNIQVALNSKGNTELTITSEKVREFRIQETSDGFEIKAYVPNELYKQVIVVDPGHGGKDPGAIIGTYREKDVNLAVTLELKKLLDNLPDTKVYYTRLDDSYPTLQERTILANEVGADFFLSLHCNSFASSYNGTETLYYPGPDTPGMDHFELAEIFQATFPAYTEFKDYTAKQRDNLYVLKHTDMPSIILEMGYLSNDHDRSYLIDPTYQDDIAKGIYESILKTFQEFPTNR